MHGISVEGGLAGIKHREAAMEKLHVVQSTSGKCTLWFWWRESHLDGVQGEDAKEYLDLWTEYPSDYEYLDV